MNVAIQQANALSRLRQGGCQVDRYRGLSDTALAAGDGDNVFDVDIQPAWYAKSLPTFSDALALVRQQLWTCLPTFPTSGSPPDLMKVSRSLRPYITPLDCTKSS